MADGGARSLLAPWIGGAASPTAPGSVRSLLAPWIGGAAAPTAVVAGGGYRSFLAFWVGGAAANENIPAVVARPVGIPEPQRQLRPVRGTGRLELEIAAFASGVIGVAGYARAVLPVLVASGSVAVGVSGTMATDLPPFIATATGSYTDFSDDELRAVVMLAMMR